MAESVEKLEDGIVRSAEQVSGQVRAAKDAIASVIFGKWRIGGTTLACLLFGAATALDLRQANGIVGVSFIDLER